MFLTLFKRIRGLGLALVLSGLVLAQNDRGIITGTVQDPAHAIVAGAAVAARNVATGAVFETRG